MHDIDENQLELEFPSPPLPDPVNEALWVDGTLFDQVTAERHRQVKKWGQQDHPVYNPAFNSVPYETSRDYYEVMASSLKMYNAFSVYRGVMGWDTILLEEVFEALELAEVDPAGYREELVQCMAVLAAMVEAHDRSQG